jgi:hypothetical protein
MQETNVDALWVWGAMYNNPDMVYFTGIHHANQVDLLKSAAASRCFIIS